MKNGPLKYFVMHPFSFLSHHLPSTGDVLTSWGREGGMLQRPLANRML